MCRISNLAFIKRLYNQECNHKCSVKEKCGMNLCTQVTHNVIQFYFLLNVLYVQGYTGTQKCRVRNDSVSFRSSINPALIFFYSSWLSFQSVHFPGIEFLPLNGSDDVKMLFYLKYFMFSLYISRISNKIHRQG